MGEGEGEVVLERRMMGSWAAVVPRRAERRRRERARIVGMLMR